MTHPVAGSPRRYPGTLADRFRDRRHERWMYRALSRALLPPPPVDFGAFGTGSFVVPPARVDLPDRIFIGEGVQILEGTWLAVAKSHDDIVPSLVIGDRARIGRFCHINCTGRVEIGDDVLISDKVLIGDAYHGYEDPDLPAQRQPMSRPRPVVIGPRAGIAIGALILPGVRIGAGSWVADWAVVSKSVPPGVIVAGNPAEIRERLEVGPHAGPMPR